MPQKIKQPPKSDSPSKRLTWWHPLFGSALDFSGKNAFQVLREVEVGQLPMLIDIIILLRDENLPLPDWTLNAAPSLFGRLNKCTIIEFKGPTDRIDLLDKLSAGPYGELVGFCFRQIQQFQRNAKDFQLRYQDYEQMNALSKELEEEILDLIPAERRLKGIPTEQRLEGIPLEGRLEGLSETEKKELLARLLADSEQDSAKN